MEFIFYILYKCSSYLYLKIRFPNLRRLRFNGHGVAIVGAKNILVGNECYVSYLTRIYVGLNSKLVLGSRVSIGHNVRIYTVKVDSQEYIETGSKKIIERDVVIKDDVIIGGNVYIGPGVTICSNVIIGANSVVASSLNESGVYSGVPAKKVH